MEKTPLCLDYLLIQIYDPELIKKTFAFKFEVILYKITLRLHEFPH